jgi:hypothetical protein
LCFCAADDGSFGVNQQRAQIAVAALADAQLADASIRSGLTRCQPDPGGEFATVGKSRWRADMGLLAAVMDGITCCLRNAAGLNSPAA